MTTDQITTIVETLLSDADLEHGPQVTATELLRNALEGLLPDELGEWASLPAESKEAGILVLADAVYHVSISMDGENPSVYVSRMPVETMNRVAVTQISRYRTWVFEFDGTKPFSVRAEQLSVINDQSRGERFARALAGRAGWSIPE